MKNGLYIVSTPIGNLGDMSLRAAETLKNCDIIICENPKHSLKLLLKLGIKKKLISLHDYNEELVIKKIRKELKNKKFCLISDAGSPLISDPGYKLVRTSVENGVYVTVVPGASSLTSALQISTIPINKYSFLGFLPKSKKNIRDFVHSLEKSNLTSVFFVSRHKIITFLEVASEELSKRKIAICKEITKINEKVFVGFPEKLLIDFKENPNNTLGEFVVVVENSDDVGLAEKLINDEILDVMNKLLNKFSLTDTVEIIHKIVKIGKKELYKKALDVQNKK